MSEMHHSIPEPKSQQIGDTSIDEKRAFCVECNLSFRSTNWLIRHDLRCHPRNYHFNIAQEHLFKCSYCPATFSRKWSRNEHEKKCCLNEVHSLPQLNEEDPSLNKEIFNARPLPQLNLQKPSLVKKIFKIQPLPQLNQEKRPKKKIRKSKFKTSVKLFQQRIITNSKSIMMDTMNKTPGGVPFEYANRLHCSYCPKLLLSVGGKIKHEKVHTGEMPYQCKLCETSFRLQCHLTSHEKKCNDLVAEVWCQFCDFHSDSVFTVERHCRKMHNGFDLKKSEVYLKKEHGNDGTSYSKSIKYEKFSDGEIPTKIQDMPIAIKSEPAYYWTQSFMIDDDDEDEDED